MEGQNRKLNRWDGFDYSKSGLYFITICADKHIEWFGNIKDKKMVLNEYGKIADNLWQEIPNHYNNVIIDVYQIMPNHIHGIIGITVGTGHCPVRSAAGGLISSEQNNNRPSDDRTEHCSVPTRDTTEHCSVPTRDTTEHCSVPTRDTTEHCSVPTRDTTNKYGLISKIVKSYKEMVIKTIRKQIGDYGFVWQRSFYDRVIRHQNIDELNRIQEYIAINPANWDTDRNNWVNSQK